MILKETGIYHSDKYKKKSSFYLALIFALVSIFELADLEDVELIINNHAVMVVVHDFTTIVEPGDLVVKDGYSQQHLPVIKKIFNL